MRAYAHEGDPPWLHRAYRYTTERKEVIDASPWRIDRLTGKRTRTEITRVVRGNREIVANDTRTFPVEPGGTPRKALQWETVETEERDGMLHYQTANGDPRAIAVISGDRKALCVERTHRADQRCGYRVQCVCLLCGRRGTQYTSVWNAEEKTRCPRCQRGEWQQRPALIRREAVIGYLDHPKLTDGGKRV